MKLSVWERRFIARALRHEAHKAEWMLGAPARVSEIAEEFDEPEDGVSS